MSYHIAPGQANIATYRRYIYAEKTGIYRKVYRDMYAEGNAEVIPPIGTINHMGKGPNFTDGKHFHMVGACCSLMVQMLPSAMNLIPIPPRHLPERARDSFLPSRLLTEKRCSRQRVPASQQYFSSRSDGGRGIHRVVRAA